MGISENLKTRPKNFKVIPYYRVCAPHCHEILGFHVT